jgi:hypothetical protein
MVLEQAVLPALQGGKIYVQVLIFVVYEEIAEGTLFAVTAYEV